MAIIIRFDTIDKYKECIDYILHKTHTFSQLIKLRSLLEDKGSNNFTQSQIDFLFDLINSKIENDELDCLDSL